MKIPAHLLLWVGVIVSRTAGLTEDEIKQFHNQANKVEEYSEAKPYVQVVRMDDVLEIRFNAVPDHYTGQWDGQNSDFTRLKSQDMKIRIRKEPTRAHSVLWCLPFGLIGVTVIGVPIYNPYKPVKGCKYARNNTYLDACRGRTDKNGVYHYYDYSPCVRSFKCDEPGEIYGVAIDGYPIYGPYDERGRLLTSKDLDECGGRLDDFGMYKYHITMDQPNFMYCLKGQIHKDLANYLNIDNFVCNCPYTDSHFKAPSPKCGESKNASSETRSGDRNARDDGAATVNNAPSQNTGDCLSAKALEDKYTKSVWGGYNITRAENVCNFTNPQNTVICKVNSARWKERPSWVYRESEMPMLPCCPKDHLNSCNRSCWVDRRISQDNINPKCKTDKIQITVRERVMVPNSSNRLAGSWKYYGSIFLSVLGTLHLH